MCFTAEERRQHTWLVGTYLGRKKTLSSIPFCLNVSFGVRIRRGDAATMSQEGADGVGFIGDSFGIRRGPENFIAGWFLAALGFLFRYPKMTMGHMVMNIWERARSRKSDKRETRGVRRTWTGSDISQVLLISPVVKGWQVGLTLSQMSYLVTALWMAPEMAIDSLFSLHPDRWMKKYSPWQKKKRLKSPRSLHLRQFCHRLSESFDRADWKKNWN